MKKILLLHPEGNINNNPNLTGVVELLCESGCSVDIYSHKSRGFYQSSPCPGAALYLENPEDIRELIALTVAKFCTPCDLVLGVDQEGIIEASRIAGMQQVPFGLISYEIFFADEADGGRKQEEALACRDAAFAVVQDETRGRLLSQENRIPPERMIYMPVAGRGSVPRVKSDYLHKKFDIPDGMKIAIYTGSIAEWSMLDALIDSTGSWPADWALVIHSRFGLNALYGGFAEKIRGGKNIYFSSEPSDTVSGLSRLLQGADAGIAFYEPRFRSKYDGKNLQHIGLASGKIATYLQHGLPIITNDIEPWRQYVPLYRLGGVVRQMQELPGCLAALETGAGLTPGCTEFFSQRLDLNKTAVPFMNRVSGILQSGAPRGSGYAGSGWLSSRLNEIVAVEVGKRAQKAACATDAILASRAYRTCARLQRIAGWGKKLLVKS